MVDTLEQRFDLPGSVGCRSLLYLGGWLISLRMIAGDSKAIGFQCLRHGLHADASHGRSLTDTHQLTHGQPDGFLSDFTEPERSQDVNELRKGLGKLVNALCDVNRLLHSLL